MCAFTWHSASILPLDDLFCPARNHRNKCGPTFLIISAKYEPRHIYSICIPHILQHIHFYLVSFSICIAFPPFPGYPV